MKIVRNFNTWQSLNEQEESKLDVDSKDTKSNKKAKKAKRKQNKKKNRTERYVSETGDQYVLTKLKKGSDDKVHRYRLKGKGKSPIWQKSGKITKDVDTFIEDELFTGKNEGKYDEDSIKIEKYKERDRKDTVTFTVNLLDQTEAKEKEADAEKKEETQTKVELPENIEGEKRINVGDESDDLLKIKEMIEVFVKNGLRLGSNFGMDWKYSKKLEEKDKVWIRAIRKGFGMPEADYISQGLVDKISAQVDEFNKAAGTNESRFFEFNDFISVFEQFDMEAANQLIADAKEEKEEEKEEKQETKEVKQKQGSDETSTSTASVGSTGFTKEIGDEYRKWANSPFAAKYYGKPSKFDLDATGDHDNSYIRKSFAQAKKDLENRTGPFDNTFGGKTFHTFHAPLLRQIISGELKPLQEEPEKAGGWLGWGDSADDLKTGEYPMGYIQKTGTDYRYAIHFAAPRPSVNDIKKGDTFTTIGAWDGDKGETTYKVLDTWTDSNGDVGAVYINAPKLGLLDYDDQKNNRDYEDKAIIKMIGK